ncbi:PAS domain S-box protein (macronuclear) [Tetrahymena thermophila SB210]|uniref:PAS domain S-box protein n=1 Tax=Tetrahymena thermophila (strain SB210) TaxID=312017 RepID=Q22AC7_TETTS|nr:PAS domain S-box protein [Tetrahymena thermophila SB210]EAR82247.2 PAS domain S-box protein [Tetrahymena thermophila SB210]|eukprot:XP_001029910.2 PAS domain S-box protein [Tetrahymena thermophila SB210]
MQNQRLFQEFLNSSDLLQYKDQKFLKVIRILLDQAVLSQNNYLLRGQGINYEIIIQLHKKQCAQNNQYCFCQKFRRNENKESLQIEELSEQHFRQEYAQLVILQLIEVFIQSSQKNNQREISYLLKLSYLSYLYEIINNPTRALVQIQKISIYILNKTNKTSLINLFYFEQLKLQILNDYQTKLFDSNIENQQLNMMETILFDDKINTCKEIFSSLLLQIGHFYDFLSGNNIQLHQLEEMSVPLINLNQNLEQNIIELFQINPSDFDLKYLTSIYIQLIDFQNRRIKEFQQTALDISKQKTDNQKKLVEIGQSSEKICVFFTSFIEKEFLIKKTSKEFDKIFGYSPEFIQGKQLNILIPNLIKRQHNQMLQSFIDEQSMDIVYQGERNLFGLDKKGFIFPISLRVKIQVFENDLGVCALVKKNKQIFSYIFFENEGVITDFSKRIFVDIFQSLGIQKQQQLNIFELIPSLEEIINTQQINKHISAVLVVKEQYSTFTSNNRFSQPKQVNNLLTQNDEIFQIQFRFFSRQTKNKVDVNYIEIDFYSKETNPVKKSMILDQLNKQKIKKESLIFQKSEGQQTIEFANSQYQQCFSTKDFTYVFDNSDQNPNKYKEDIKHYQNNFQKQQTEKSKSSKTTELTQNQNDTNKLTFQNSNNNYLRYLSDQAFQKSSENSNINQRNYELKQLNLNGLSDKQNQELQLSMINSPNKVLTSAVDQTEMILSPAFSYQEKQQFLINQSNENYNLKLYSQQVQQNSNNLQEISLNNISSYQNLNRQHSKNNIAHYQHIKQNSFFDNNFQRKKTTGEELSVNKRESRSFNNFREQDDQKQEQKNEIASVNSSKYSTEEIMKRKMIQRIKKKDFNRGLQLMVLAGISAFVILSIVSLIIYFENLNSLDSFVLSFLKIDHALYCFIDIMNFVALNNYQSVLGGQSLIIDKLDLQNQEYKQSDYQQQAILKDYSANLQNIVLNNDSTDQLNDLQNNLFQVQIYSSGFYNNNRVQKNSTTTFEQSLQYTLMQFFYEIRYYYISFEESQEDFIWGNIVSFKQRMKNLQLIVENYATEQFNKMNLQQISAIVLFTSISAFLVFSVLPLNILIQIYKEKILKLFGTFQPSIIEFQIKQIELGLFKIEQINILEQTNNSTYSNKRSTSKRKQIQQVRDLNFYSNQQDQEQKYENKLNYQIPLYVQRKADKRTRQIASFSKIPKFNFFLFFLGIIAVALLLIIPILNFVEFNPFERESKVTLNDRISLIDVLSLIIENQSPQMEQVYLIAIGIPPQTSYYQSYIQNLQDQNNQVFQYFQNLTADLGVERNNQKIFMDFYQNLLNENVCSVRENYPQYFNSNITQSRCNQLFNGILQRGLIFSIQKVFQTFQEIYQIYQIQDIHVLIKSFKYLQKSYSFIEFKQLIQVISEVVNAIRQYQNEQLQQYEINLKQNLLYLFIIQLVIICLVFLIGWLYLFQWFRNQLQRATKIFTLFHINLLYENDFIQSYFRKISQKQS